MRCASERAAPRRSRHQPSGRAPITLFASTTQRTPGWWQAPRIRPLRFLPVRRTVAAVSAVALLALSGCGGGGDAQTSTGASYVKQVNRAQQAFATQVERLSSGITPSSSDATDKKTLGSFVDAVDGVATELRGITPPAKVRDLHAKLVRSVDAYGDQVRVAVTALGSRSPTRLRRAQRDLSAATASFGTTLNGTIQAINARLSS
jgi:hypothetical protein